MKHMLINMMIAIVAGVFVGAAQASDPNRYLNDVKTAEDPDLRMQHAFKAQQIMQCSFYAQMGEMEAIAGIMIKNMRVYQKMAGVSEEEALQQAFNASRHRAATAKGYLQGYKARLLETGGDLSEIDEQFHMNTGKVLYRENYCAQWATFVLEDSED